MNRRISIENPSNWVHWPNADETSPLYIACAGSPLSKIIRTNIFTSGNIPIVDNQNPTSAFFYLDATIDSMDIAAGDNAFISVITINPQTGREYFEDYQIHAFQTALPERFQRDTCQIWTNVGRRITPVNNKVRIPSVGVFNKYDGQTIRLQIMIEKRTEESQSHINFGDIEIFSSDVEEPILQHQSRRSKKIEILGGDGNPGSGTTGPRQPPRG